MARHINFFEENMKWRSKQKEYKVSLFIYKAKLNALIKYETDVKEIHFYV